MKTDSLCHTEALAQGQAHIRHLLVNLCIRKPGVSVLDLLLTSCKPLGSSFSSKDSSFFHLQKIEHFPSISPCIIKMPT